MTEELVQLPPPEKKIAAKVLYDMGWGSRKIEEWLGIDHSTVIRYAAKDIPDEMRQFAKEFEAAILDMKYEGLARIYKRIIELVPKERRLDQLVKAGQFFEGLGTKSEVQVNNIAVTNNQQIMSDKELAKLIHSMTHNLDA